MIVYVTRPIHIWVANNIQMPMIAVKNMYPSQTFDVSKNSLHYLHMTGSRGWIYWLMMLIACDTHGLVNVK